jgi:hypothetical protein
MLSRNFCKPKSATGLIVGATVHHQDGNIHAVNLAYPFPPQKLTGNPQRIPMIKFSAQDVHDWFK